MTDPYKVLGIERGASDEELKKAYRAMSRKYHPDANVNNPDKDKAEEKFKEVQAAYQQILYEKEHPYASSDYGTSGAGHAGYGGQGAPGGQGGYGGQSYGDWSDFWNAFGGFWGSSGSQGGYSGRAQGTSDEEQLKYQAAGNYINSRRYKEALNVLSSILQRSGIWYYYSAMANAGMGNNVIALEHARTATQMEPANQNYRMLLARLQSGSGWYANRQNTYTAPVDGTVGWCVRLCAINVALNLCCGGGYVCC